MVILQSIVSGQRDEKRRILDIEHMVLEDFERIFSSKNH